MTKPEVIADETGGAPVRDDPTFHCMDVESVCQMFNTSPSSGLSAQEAAERLLRDGPNKMTEKKKRTIWQKIWDQVANVLVFILFVVAVISFVKGVTAAPGSEDQITSLIEVALILGVIILNTWIGIRQEGSAEKSADALKSMLSSDAMVIRDGTKQSVPAEDLVVGDLVCLNTGDKIPADVRMVKVANMAAQEAALTGEAVPIDKHTDVIESESPTHVPLGDRKNMAFSATSIVAGEGNGVVVCTGDNTEIGKISELVNNQEQKKTAVAKQIDMVSKWIAVFVITIAIVTLLVARFRTGQEWLEAVTTALVTAVAMIPEGLAAIVTLTYAWAVSNMAEQKAIVRVLPAVETLGSVTVICSDKTGTLTQNIMSMVAFVISDGRFRVDFNSTDRKPENFVRDDGYMAHKRGENVKKIDNSNTAAAAVAVADSSSSLTPEEGKGVEMSTIDVTVKSNSAGVAQGQSPSAEYVKSMLATGVLCSKAELPADGSREGSLGNPTEISIIRAAFFAGTDHTAMRNEQPEIASVPFSSEYKFMATVHEATPQVDGPEANGLIVHVKGAIDRLLPLCAKQVVSGNVNHGTEPVNKEYWNSQAEQLSSHGYRVLCLCRAHAPAGSIVQDQKLDREFVDGRNEPWLTIVGLAAIQDPPRPECVQAIKEAHAASVRVAMITGDHKATALAIGEELGIVDSRHPDAITGPEMDELSNVELQTVVMTHNVFARASPENKIRIVKALQAQGQVSSMTGDGVNDAPALKAADMGVAMGKEGTDVARESAEMILADDNFATIVTAVREGRVVWDNLRKVLLFNTPVNNAQGLTVLFGMIVGLPYAPLTPIQVLYCNLICAVTLGFVLAVEPAEKGIMARPPRKVGKRLIGRYLLFRIAFGTLVLVTFTVGAVMWVFGWGISDNINQFTEPLCVANNMETTTDPRTNEKFCCMYRQNCDAFDQNSDESCTNQIWILGDPKSASPFEFEIEHNRYGMHCPNVVGRAKVRAQASNTLTLSAISIMLSARFAYNSAIHPRLFKGNKYAWLSAAITAILQVCITYIPGLNNIVFQMGPMNGPQWGICFLFVVLTFFCMEAEKAVMRLLKSRKYDTDDENDIIVEPNAAQAEADEDFVTTMSQRSAALRETLLRK